MFLKTFQVIKNNWKKSVFFFCVSAYGINYARNKIRINELMRVYCEDALKFGEQPLSPYSAARHVTVVLNPIAKDKKCKQNYDKYISPLLNCAGLRVSLIQTEHEKQAKDLLSIMSNTDAVILVGGLGLVSEAITGLLQRNDSDELVKKLPIGIIPVSKRNLLKNKLFSIDKQQENESINDNNNNENKNSNSVNEVNLIAKKTLAVIKETLSPVDVIKVENKSKQKTVYAFNSIEIGSLTKLNEQIDKYWYLGSYIKPYFTLLKGILLNRNSSLLIAEELNICYTGQCSGCSKCSNKLNSLTFNEQVNNQLNIGGRRWWHSFVKTNNVSSNKKTNLNEKVNSIDFNSIENDNCEKWFSIDEKRFHNLIIKNSIDQIQLNLILHENGLSKRDLINEGLKLYKNDGISKQEKIKIYSANDVEIKFGTKINVLEEEQTSLSMSSVADVDDEQNDLSNKRDTVINKSSLTSSTSKVNHSGSSAMNLSLSIDSESYEIESGDEIRLTLLPKRINIYQ